MLTLIGQAWTSESGRAYQVARTLADHRMESERHPQRGPDSETTRRLERERATYISLGNAQTDLGRFACCLSLIASRGGAVSGWSR